MSGPDNPDLYRRRRRGRGGLWGPLFLIGLGVIFLLDQYRVLAADRAFSFFWPFLFLFAGVRMLACGRARNQVLAVLLIVFGGALALRSLGYLQFDPGHLWPLALIAAGVSMLFGAGSRSRTYAGNATPWTDPADPPGNVLDIAAVFGGAKQRVVSQDLKGGHLLAMFGGFQLDLTGASFAGDACVLEANAFFGGGEILVPPSWQVVLEGHAILGGFADDTRPITGYASAQSKRLIVRGTAMFGGVNIKN